MGLEEEFERGWLARQLRLAKEDKKKWPEWMRRQTELYVDEFYPRKNSQKKRDKYQEGGKK